MSEPKDLRSRGLAKMKEVYGFTVDPSTVPGGFAGVTIDRLFGELWSDETLSTSQRRLLTVGVLASLGRGDLLEIQFDAALANGELSEDQLRALVLHLAHYVGWPLATTVNESVERVLARRHAPPDAPPREGARGSSTMVERAAESARRDRAGS